MGHILELGEITMDDGIRYWTVLDQLFKIAEANGITKRQIGIVVYGKNWRNIYKIKGEDARIAARNRKIEHAIQAILEGENA